MNQDRFVVCQENVVSHENRVLIIGLVDKIWEEQLGVKRVSGQKVWMN